MPVTYFNPGTSLLHKLHPSTKLVLWGMCFVLTYALPWEVRWILAIVLFTALWASGVPPGRYKLPLLVIGAGALTVPLLNGLWIVPDDPLIFPIWGDLGFRTKGLVRGLDFSGLYTALGMETIVIITTTRLWQLASAPSSLGAPHVVAFALSYVFWYMPEVFSQYLHLMDVWKTRGVDFNKGPLWEKFWTQCRLLATLLILEFSRVRAKSNAVEARGFSLKKAPTTFILQPIPRVEKALLVTATILTLVALIVRLTVYVTQGG